MAERDPYEEARKRVKEKKQFFRALFSWIFTSIFLFVINIMTSPGFLWALFPFVGWGIGIAIKGFEVFGYPGMSSDWEEEEIEREMRRMDRRRLSSGKKDDQLDLPPLEKDEDQAYRREDLV
ncbi:MAG: 2TM domain-containing protein [Bacteroidetes bacterium]|nr:2TM domain-containing protein [Bacteroidota bacterium]